MSNTLKVALQTYQKGDFSAALDLTRKVIFVDRLRTQEIYALLGNTSLKLGRTVDAADAFAEGARLPGARGALLAKLALNLYQGVGARDKILLFGEKAVALNPGDTETAFIHASALFAEGRYHEVDAYVDKLDTAVPAHNALIINHHRLRGNFDYLSTMLDAATKANPADMLLKTSRFVVAREVCDFPVLEEYARIMETPDSAEAVALLNAEPALGRLYWCDDEDILRRPNSSSLAAQKVPASPSRRPVSPDGTRLRIGYLSSDFYDHATMRLFLQVLHAHDLERFDVTILCYSESHHLAWQRQNFPKALQTSIVSLRDMTDAAAAKVIAGLGIDILVDLKGHTMNARLGIVSLSDAPVKATYLGYPGSVTGVDLDYAISDTIVTPDSSRPFYHEKLCRLPETYQCNDAVNRPLTPASNRADWGLPEDAFILASFNAPQKLNPETIRIWAGALNAVPRSLLWLMCEKPLARRNLALAFERLGIDRERIIFCGHTENIPHLARMPLADLALDSFPYNGHTTTSDMLWAGLPVLTIKGNCFAARVSESLLHAIGLPELVADDTDDFAAIVAGLAADPQRLSAMRQRLEDDRFIAPLFDSERLTRHLEMSYTLMATRARKGLPADHIDVPALATREGPFLDRSR